MDGLALPGPEGGAIFDRGGRLRIVASVFTGNRCDYGRTWGANPAGPGTPGGGSGGAIHNDGDRMTLTVGGCLFADNHANEGGGAIFFVSDDRTGTMSIRDSSLDSNVSDGFQTPGLPGIFFLGARRPTIVRTILR